VLWQDMAPLYSSIALNRTIAASFPSCFELQKFDLYFDRCPALFYNNSRLTLLVRTCRPIDPTTRARLHRGTHRRCSLMQESLKASLVRIHTADGHVVGAGFLVGERHILTCAHVVAGALGLADDASEKPQVPVHLDVPRVAPRKLLTARVVL